MSWTRDLSDAVAALDLSRRRLRSFGLAAGGLLCALGLGLAARGPVRLVGLLLAGAGAALLAGGALAPGRLAGPYRAWMAAAFAVGWPVSRLLLTAIFALVVVPVALLARLSGKRFLDLRPDPAASSYWVRRDPGRRADYEKMS